MGDAAPLGLPTQAARQARAVPPARGSRTGEVYDAALTLFVERGYHGTTMRDIGLRLGVRAPSLYNHIDSKQVILRDVMISTEMTILAEFHEAVLGVDDAVEGLRRAIGVFVLRHARHRREALVGNREVASLEEPARSQLLRMRREHEHAVRDLIEQARTDGRFSVAHPHLASFAMLEMGVSVARWFADDNSLSATEVAAEYGDLAVRMCGLAP